MLKTELIEVSDAVALAKQSPDLIWQNVIIQANQMGLEGKEIKVVAPAPIVFGTFKIKIVYEELEEL